MTMEVIAAPKRWHVGRLDRVGHLFNKVQRVGTRRSILLAFCMQVVECVRMSAASSSAPGWLTTIRGDSGHLVGGVSTTQNNNPR